MSLTVNVGSNARTRSVSRFPRRRSRCGAPAPVAAIFFFVGGRRGRTLLAALRGCRIAMVSPQYAGRLQCSAAAPVVATARPAAFN
jgi:hypothetical protein